MSDDLKDTLTDDSNNPWTPRQQFLFRWQWLLIFGPFVLTIVLPYSPLASVIDETKRLDDVWVYLVMVAVGWAVAFKGYLLYLTYQK